MRSLRKSWSVASGVLIFLCSCSGKPSLPGSNPAADFGFRPPAPVASGPVPNVSVTPTRPPRPTRDGWGRYLLLNRGLYVQFERRGWPSGYSPGETIQLFTNFDSVVNSLVSDEVSLQLDAMRAMGVNTITFELRTAGPTTDLTVFPTCNINTVLGLQWPQPSATELTNLPKFFDLVQSKGMRIWLRLTNTHQEENPPTNAETWLGSILGAIGDHPALDLVLFEGDLKTIDTNNDMIPDSCGGQAETPLWLGPTSVNAHYVKWAIAYAMSLGMGARKLSAEEVVGAYILDAQIPSGWNATDGHLWQTVGVMKSIFDALNIPDAQRTYALSFYENRKCFNTSGVTCVPDEIAPLWDDAEFQTIFSLITANGAKVGPNGARVVVPEFGNNVPVDPNWSTPHAVENFYALMEKFGVEGGSFWRWASFNNSEDSDSTLATPVEIRGLTFTYNPVQKEILDMGGFHLASIANPSFESSSNSTTPDHWFIAGYGNANWYDLTQESGQPEVLTRGTHALRLATGSATNGGVTATSDPIKVSPGIQYTTTANMRFSWTGDLNPSADPTQRPQVFVNILCFRIDGSTCSQPATAFRYFQEDSTVGFETFPVQYTPPSDAWSVRVQFGIARNGLPSPIVFDVDNVR